MKAWSYDRPTVFLSLVLFFFLWDLAFFLGIRDPVRFPHPFALFGTLGDVEALRGFTAFLREVIFSFVVGCVIGIGVGSRVLCNSRLTRASLSLLRTALWIPFILIFAVPPAFLLNITVVMLSACYHFISANYYLGLGARSALFYAARESTFQALFFSLISQLWAQHWQWLLITDFQRLGTGLQAWAALAALIGLINWCFRSSFVQTASYHGARNTRALTSESWKTVIDSGLIVVGFFVAWQLLSVLEVGFFRTSPHQALAAAFHLFWRNEIWGDMGHSLSEVMGGLLLGGLAALGVISLLSSVTIFSRLLFRILPLAQISPIVLWFILFVLWFNWFGTGWGSFLYFWHKVVAVGCLSFFPLVQTLWGIRERPFLSRLLLAIDDALPIAFVAMLFGEMYAATQGLGFAMTIVKTTGESAKAIAWVLITFALLVGLSMTARWGAKRLYSPGEASPAIPV